MVKAGSIPASPRLKKIMKGYTMDYKIIRVTLDIAVPDYGGKYQASGMDYIDVHSDAQSLGFSEQEMQLKAGDNA
jgi:hypothetical protein